MSFDLRFRFFLIAGLSVLLLRWILPYTAPFLLAFLISIFLEPLVQWLQGYLFHRGLATFFAIAIVLAFFVSSIAVGSAILVHELHNLLTHLPLWMEQYTTSSVRGVLGASLQRFTKDMAKYVFSLSSTFLGFFSHVPEQIFFLVITFVSTFFVLYDWPAYISLMAELWPAHLRTFRSVQGALFMTVIGYLRAELLLVSLTMVLTALGLRLVGQPYYLLIGFVTGLLDLFPVVGPLLLFLPWALFAWLQGNAVLAIQLVLVIGAVGLLRQMLEARIIGGQIGLHPLITLISIYVGIQMFGSSGFLIGPVVAVVLRATWDSVMLKTRR